MPILVAGGSRAALVRCARWGGDGWHPIGGAVAALKAQIETLSEQWAERGRDAAEMRVVARYELDLLDSGSADPSTLTGHRGRASSGCSSSP